MLAQEKIHPSCSQKPPEVTNFNAYNSIVYNQPPSCQFVVEQCREDLDCEKKLEKFEQDCSIDSATNRCAGRTSQCRLAVLGILGTQLRMTCGCHGLESQQLYDCLSWQKLLWLNPCIGEKNSICFKIASASF